MATKKTAKPEDKNQKVDKKNPKIDNDNPQINYEAVQDKKKIKRKVYEKELYKLQIELIKLQEWIKEYKLKVVVIFEGRDAAGKIGRAHV